MLPARGCEPGSWGGGFGAGGSPPAWCARFCPQRRSRHPTGTGSAAGKPAHAPGGCSARPRGSVPGEQRGAHLSFPQQNPHLSFPRLGSLRLSPPTIPRFSPCPRMWCHPSLGQDGASIPKGLCLPRCSPPSPRHEQCLSTAAGAAPPFQAGSDPPAGALPGSAGVWGRIWSRYLQQEPLAAHDSGSAPVDDLGEGQLPAVTQQHRDAGSLWRDPAGWDRAPRPR